MFLGIFFVSKGDWHSGSGMFDDLFGNFFGGNRQGFEKNWRESKESRDREAELTVSFEEAALGGTKTIRISGAKDQSLKVRIPAKKVGDTMDIGMCAAFLCSDAARYITGSCITVDGGALIGF